MYLSIEIVENGYIVTFENGNTCVFTELDAMLLSLRGHLEGR